MKTIKHKCIIGFGSFPSGWHPFVKDDDIQYMSFAYFHDYCLQCGKKLNRKRNIENEDRKETKIRFGVLLHER